MLSQPPTKPVVASTASTTVIRLKDVQAAQDKRGISLDEVGVSDLRYPITIHQPDGEVQHSTGAFSLSVDLPRDLKGTHMSRFVEALNEFHQGISPQALVQIATSLRTRLVAKSANARVEFPFFITKAAPVTGAKAIIDVNCQISARVSDQSTEVFLAVETPVTSLCPCSKEISDYGAHNQRGQLRLKVQLKQEAEGTWNSVGIGDLVTIAEKSASAPIYSLLKRPDERHVTMQAFDNPVFVEDMVRNAAMMLKTEPRIDSFEVRAVNNESIHNHSAFAIARGGTTRDGKADGLNPNALCA